MKDMPVTVSDELKTVLSQCQPGQTKEISITVAMDESGKITLTPSDSEYGEAGPDETEAETPAAPAPMPMAKTKAKRAKPVMDAINQMYA